MEQRIGIIMNGVTGRMGLNQHLIRSVLAIRDDGGLKLTNGSKLIPDPISYSMPFRSIWPTRTLVKTASCNRPYRIWDQEL